MRFSSWLVVGGLLLSLVTTVSAQNSFVSGTVKDSQDRPIADAAVTLTSASSTFHTTSNDQGRFEFPTAQAGAAEVRVNVPGFAPETVAAGSNLDIHLKPATVNQNVVVSAARTALPEDTTASSTRVLPSEQLSETAAATLDDKLRQVPGFELFRRSSSRVSNPTSQGVSLRGLGSTAASRTLVLADLMPMNDPFGGWVQWDEVPQLLVQQVELVRGGGSDLYGSSAIGGVIDLVERPPTLSAGELQLSYGEQNTREASLLQSFSHGPWHALFAGDFFRTDGYTLVTPDERGLIDQPSNVHYQNAALDVERTLGNLGSAFIAGNLLNEARANGTDIQNNATRLWRYDAGFNWNATQTAILKFRAYGAQEHYRQSFSSVSVDRNSETLTRLQRVPTQELGVSVQWLQSFGSHFTLIAGADSQDVRATDFENTFFHKPTGYVDVTARQRQTGLYAEGILQLQQWTVTASARYDNFQNLDATKWTLAKGSLTTLPIADRTQNVGDPRVGVVRRLTSNLSFTVDAFRAFRSPTMNELYRTGQVGQQITLANPDLLSERATGWESGLEFANHARTAVVRGSYFWTEVNRPVIALTLSQSGQSITLQRENLGQIRSRGVSLDAEVSALRWLTLTGGYQYANATVTRADQEPALIGNWIPQVPHNTATAQATAHQRKLGTLAVQLRASGHQFDDDQNQYLLHSFFRADAFASHAINRWVEAFVSAENLFDRTIEVGRTPILTLGTPRVVQGGLRIYWSGENPH